MSPYPRGPQEQEILAAPRLVAAITGALVMITIAALAVAADHGAFAGVQRLDQAWLRLMTDGRVVPLTAIAKIFNILGLVYFTVPVRIGIACLLALRRQWWHLAAFAAAVVSSEILIGLLKTAYNRARPPGALVATSGASFPSGHSVAASVTVVAAVIALAPAGKTRARWSVAAVAFSILMGLSRAYLGAHWLSDAVAGLLIGTSCALVAAVAVDQFQRRHRRVGRAQPPAAVPRRDRAEERRGPA